MVVGESCRRFRSKLTPLRELIWIVCARSRAVIAVCSLSSRLTVKGSQSGDEPVCSGFTTTRSGRGGMNWTTATSSSLAPRGAAGRASTILAETLTSRGFSEEISICRELLFPSGISNSAKPGLSRPS